ncbi:LysR substrate-binding domain-containing protein [Burkholderia sp. Ac-20379]|uniref:LysR substrate-binding domain-containing protein n=1 Tax=Burkholderia sp. Ac-20379 TaxID=2703900 RepID=UPI00197E826D|nr:LysR substrate-binding domain-containing protein [Burkholderia sp. Ac-20379]MBN3724177.1 LysR family transcriptional regulator [Burkholderia sp. Ac-20379]
MSSFNAKRNATLPPLETLRCFESVARLGSFTRAARELCMTQSAASKQVRTLESMLGCTLFERHTRALGLSEAGRRLFDELQPLLSRMQHTLSRVRNDDREPAISVICTDAVAQYWLLPRLADFARDCPRIPIDVSATNAINEKRCTDVSFGILYGDGAWTSLDAIRLFPEIVYPVYNPARYAGPVPDTVEALAQAPLIHLDSTDWDCLDWRDWFAQFSQESIPAPLLTFNQTGMVYEAARLGLGIGLGWDFIAQPAIRAGELGAIRSMSLVTGRHDYLVHPRGKALSADERRFRDWLAASADADRSRQD